MRKRESAINLSNTVLNQMAIDGGCRR